MKFEAVLRLIEAGKKFEDFEYEFSENVWKELAENLFFQLKNLAEMGFRLKKTEKIARYQIIYTPTVEDGQLKFFVTSPSDLYTEEEFKNLCHEHTIRGYGTFCDCVPYSVLLASRREFDK